MTRVGSILGLVTTVTLGACSDERPDVAIRSPAELPQSGACPLAHLRGVRAHVTDVRGGVAIAFEGPNRAVELLRATAHAMAAARDVAGDPFAVCPCGDRSAGGSAVATPATAARDLGVTSMQPSPTTTVLPPAAATVEETAGGATLVLIATDGANVDALRIAAGQEVGALAGCLTVAYVRAASSIGCFLDQVRIDGFCIDKYEAYVVEVDERGDELAHSPYAGVEGLRVRAKVAANVVPQGYISQVEASRACAGAGKSLCTADQFLRAGRGPTGPRSTRTAEGSTRREPATRAAELRRPDVRKRPPAVDVCELQRPAAQPARERSRQDRRLRPMRLPRGRFRPGRQSPRVGRGAGRPERPGPFPGWVVRGR